MEEIKENDENISYDPNEDMPLLKPKRKMKKNSQGLKNNKKNLKRRWRRERQM